MQLLLVRGLHPKACKIIAHCQSICNVWLGSSLVLLSSNATILHIYRIFLLVLLTAMGHSGMEKTRQLLKHQLWNNVTIKSFTQTSHCIVCFADGFTIVSLYYLVSPTQLLTETIRQAVKRTMPASRRFQCQEEEENEMKTKILLLPGIFKYINYETLNCRQQSPWPSNNYYQIFNHNLVPQRTKRRAALYLLKWLQANTVLQAGVTISPALRLRPPAGLQ